MAGRLAAKLPERRNRRSNRPVGIVLIYHEVAPTQGDWSREVIPAQGESEFRAQLEYLKRHYEVVPLRELTARAGARSPGQRLPVALTFDDDLSCYDSIVAPLLEGFGFPATFFLTGNCLQGPSSFWWQDLQTIIDRGPEAWSSLRRELANDWPWAGLEGGIHEVAETIEALPRDEHDAVATRLRGLAGPDSLEDGLPAEAAKRIAQRGFEIGFHTLRHLLLPPMNAEDLDRAMRDGVDELAAATGYRPTTISYPYGKANLRVAEAAQRAGFECGVVGGHGATGPDQHPLLLVRFSPWTDSLGSFTWNLARVAMAG